MEDVPPRAGIYTRMSLVVMGDTTKVDDQERRGRDTASALGWDAAEVYCDNNRSAWRKDRKRPAWDRMLADVESGKISAIVVYHGDRLIRQPEDLTALLKLADGRGVQLASPTGTRDLGNPDDRFVLYIEAAMAMRESDNISRRRKAQYERWRREGKVRPGGRGGRAFGFSTGGTVLPPDRCVIATRQVTGEPDLIREMAARILAGEDTGAVAADVTRRGWRTPAGSPFTHGTVRKMLARPRYAGLMPDGVSRAAWDPVIDRADWEVLCAVLAARGRKYVPRPSNGRRYLLSGLAVCGVCGAGLRMMETRGKSRASQMGYSCPRPGCRKVFRSVAHLDAYVAGRVVFRLANPANPAAGTPGGDRLAGEILALEERRAETVAVIDSLADHPGERPALLYRAVESFDRRIGELRERAAGDDGERLRRQHQGMTREQFDAAPLSVRRALVAACFRVTVLPSSKRGPGFRSGDVVMEPVRPGA